MAVSAERKTQKFAVFSENPRFKQYSTLVESSPTISNVFYLGDLIYPGLSKGKKAWLTRKMGRLLKIVASKGAVDEGDEDLFIRTVEPFVKDALDSLGAVAKMNVEIALNELKW